MYGASVDGRANRGHMVQVDERGTEIVEHDRELLQVGQGAAQAFSFALDDVKQLFSRSDSLRENEKLPRAERTVKIK
jgi:hypothetical protein